MTTEPRCLAVIPARGGSKRLPRKNVLPFNGRPIIEYTIEAALESGCFERVVVSSDDDEILRVGSANMNNQAWPSLSPVRRSTRPSTWR